MQAEAFFADPSVPGFQALSKAAREARLGEAVKSAHPDRAIAIWKEAAEEAIARANVRGYEAAEPYLRKMKDAFTQAGRGQEWEEYLASLRERNRRRPRCLEVLDRVEG